MQHSEAGIWWSQSYAWEPCDAAPLATSWFISPSSYSCNHHKPAYNELNKLGQQKSGAPAWFSHCWFFPHSIPISLENYSIQSSKNKKVVYTMKKKATYWEFSPFLARISIYWWYTYPPEKYECVKWDDDIPNWMEIHRIPWFQSPPTSLGYKPTHWEYLGLWAMGITWYPFQSLEVMIQPFWTLFWTHFLIAKFFISPSNLMKSQCKKSQKSHEIRNNKLLNGIFIWDFHDKYLMMFNDF